MSEDPNQLDYRDPKLDRPVRSQAIAQFVGGVVVGLIATGIIGFGIGLSHLSFGGPGAPRQSLLNSTSVCFGAAVLVGAPLAIWLQRRERFFLAGLACGIAVLASVETLCFAFG